MTTQRNRKFKKGDLVLVRDYHMRDSSVRVYTKGDEHLVPTGTLVVFLDYDEHFGKDVGWILHQGFSAAVSLVDLVRAGES